ncbi:MAG TPA: PEP-CTERM sorting domain-containing protein [Planctomycetaceae bacterium]|nr:PEP-CTERM sorting domain-containing protein [Planctomycetaceae bacterium]
MSFRLPRGAFVALMLVLCAKPAAATLITFDDFSAAPVNDAITNGYKGYNWSNVWIANKNAFAGTGFANGAVSGNYTGFNGFGVPAEITSPTLFDFVSVYLTGGFNPGTVTFSGFQGTTLLYTQSFVVNTASPQLVFFNFNGVNRLSFSSTGGHFAMDNLTLNAAPPPVPEPTSLALCGMGALGMMFGGLRRRRQQTTAV